MLVMLLEGLQWVYLDGDAFLAPHCLASLQSKVCGLCTAPGEVCSRFFTCNHAGNDAQGHNVPAIAMNV